jgi:UDP-N-acetylglucosamine 3-dehydrogenase
MPTPNRPLRCGAVGVGRMGRHHARVYAQMAAATPRPSRWSAWSTPTRTPPPASPNSTTPRPSRPCRNLLAAGVDAVSVAVPTTYHLAVTEPLPPKPASRAWSRSPWPASDTDDANKLKDVAETRPAACLMVGHIERFNPVMRAMQKATEKTGKGLIIIPRFMQVHPRQPP